MYLLGVRSAAARGRAWTGAVLLERVKASVTYPLDFEYWERRGGDVTLQGAVLRHFLFEISFSFSFLLQRNSGCQRSLPTFWRWPSLHMPLLMANSLSVRNASVRLCRTRILQTTAYNEHLDNILTTSCAHLVHRISDYNELFPNILRF